MSYCRWSTDDFQCDLYVYESVGDFWSTNVAYRRYVFSEPLPPQVELDGNNVTEWYARYQKVMNRLHETELVVIDLPHAGESFADDTPGECADRLESLKQLGYRFPDDVIAELRQEEFERIERGE